MSKKLFGTDGVRGVANEKITPELAFQIGQAAGAWLKGTSAPARVLVGRDTRKSGPMLGAALASGFCSVGVDVETLGVFPTGGVCYLTMVGDYGMGAVISASHNPAEDNGIKLVGDDGRKIPEEVERLIEATLEGNHGPRPLGGDVGSLSACGSAVQTYSDWLVSKVPEGLEGMTVAMDCGHGSAWEIAPAVFERLGAKVVPTGIRPTGMNINAEGGATKPETIQQLSVLNRVDIGVAFDGDADRAVFSDSQGRLINGDRTMAIWCAHWRHEGQLDPALVVGTVMTNGGFEQYMTREGVALERADVGDKYVSALLREKGGRIGGEQSGHIIFSDQLPTGDGLLTALEICRVLSREKRQASDFFGDYDSWPQSLVNVKVGSTEGWRERPAIAHAIVEAETALTGRGRLNIRPSGTQPVIRIMVEADAEGLRDQVSDSVVQVLLAELGGEIYSRVDLTHALGD